MFKLRLMLKCAGDPSESCLTGGDDCCEGLVYGDIRKCGLGEGDCDDNSECQDGIQLKQHTLLTVIMNLRVDLLLKFLPEVTCR